MAPVSSAGRIRAVSARALGATDAMRSRNMAVRRQTLYSSQLLAKNISEIDERARPSDCPIFLGREWQSANAKARELGWIV